MKKISFIIVCGAIAFASCKNGANVDTTKQQAHIDSVVNAFLDTQKATLQKNCDDNIMQAAQDSAKEILENEKKMGMHHWAPKPVVKKVEPKSTTPTISNRPGASNQTQGTISNRPGASNNPNTSSGAVNTIKKRPGAN